MISFFHSGAVFIVSSLVVFPTPAVEGFSSTPAIPVDSCKLRTPSRVLEAGHFLGGLEPSSLARKDSVRWIRPFPKVALFMSNEALDKEETSDTKEDIGTANGQMVAEGSNGVGMNDENSNGAENPLANFFNFAPRPPDTPPPSESYQELLKERGSSVISVAELEERVGDLQRELAKKEAALKEGESFWVQERSALADKIDSMSGELEDKEITLEEVEQERERLQREVSLLQGQLPQVQNMLRSERQRADELTERLADIDDAMEYQQMEFEKNKVDLQKTLEEEKKRLKDIETNWEGEKGRFIHERKAMEEQIELEQKRLEAAQNELRKTQETYQKEREMLEDKLEAKRSSLEENEKNLEREKKEGSANEAVLKAEISTTRSKLVKAEEFLNKAQQLFNRTEAQLKDNLRKEQDKVAQITRRLDDELKKFEKEKEILEMRIQSEKAVIREVEQQLHEERVESAKDKLRLENALLEEVRIRKLKKKQMKNRYDQIRSEMTALWEGAKRDARKEKTELQKRYEGKLKAMRDTTEKLEKDLRLAISSKEDLSAQLKEKDAALKKAAVEEVRLTKINRERTLEIVSLKSTLIDVREELTQKNSELESLREELREKDYKLSTEGGKIRNHMKASLKITGSRVKGVGTRFRNIFRRKRTSE